MLFKNTVKAFAAFAGLTAITNSNAQITINKNDLLSGADTIRMSVGAITNVSDPSLTGTNYNWDYSTLTPTIQFVDTFVAVSSTPIAYQLFFNNPLSTKYKANFAQKTTNISFATVSLSNIYNYVQNSSTANAYSIVGFGATINSIPTSVRYDSIDVVYKYPMNYNNRDSSVSKYIVSIPTLGAYGQRKKRVNHVEGWGTVKTPYGSFSALKVKSTLYITDTIYYSAATFGTKVNRPVQIDYSWIAAGQKVPLLTISTGATGIVTSVDYKDIKRNVTQVGIKEQSVLNSLRVYPNPTSDVLHINYNLNNASNVKIDVVNTHGQIIKSINNSVKSTGIQTEYIDLTGIAKGIYFVQLTTANETKVEKLIVD
jgi:hypothetical protein